MISCLDWLSIWLTQRTQCVVLDGFLFNHITVKSGVPQGTVLGPIIYINDTILEFLRHWGYLKMIVSYIIESDQDQSYLQSDFNLIFVWSKSW